MQTLDWYFDFISPFAYLQQERFDRLPADVEVCCKPVLLAGLLDHWGSKGPAEVPAKRIFTYRHVHWLAGQHGIPFRMPPAHPFNPLKLLRLAIALGNQAGTIQEIFRFVWRDGQSTEDPSAWAALTAKLGLANAAARIDEPVVKQALRRTTEEAIARGVFGVPTFWVDGELFWGFDATGMLLDYLNDPSLFQDPEMQRISNLPVGVQRL
jgi:2-hydroxychromene-2-carboxylate isomerase